MTQKMFGDLTVLKVSPLIGEDISSPMKRYLNGNQLMFGIMHSFFKVYFDKLLPLCISKGHKTTVTLSHINSDLHTNGIHALTYLDEYIVEGTRIFLDEYLVYPGWLKLEHNALIEYSNLNDITLRYTAVDEQKVCSHPGEN